MDIHFRCLRCNQPMVADESLTGHDLECPQCHQLRRVPAPVQLAQHSEEQSQRVAAPPEHLPAVTPVDSPPRSVAAQEEYRCNNPDCGGLWLENQLLVLEHGETAVRVCPNCRLGVTRIIRPSSFWTHLPDAFVYPLRDGGVWMLVAGTPLLAFLDFAKHFASIIVVVLATVFVLGYFGMLLLEVISTTANQPEDSMTWPDLSGFSEVLSVAGQLVGTTVVVFLPAIVCQVVGGEQMNRFGETDAAGGLWMLAAVVLAGLGALYYPMALVAVAIFNTVSAVNPLLVVPAILKTLPQYAVVVALVGAMIVIRLGMSMALVVLPIIWKIAAFLPIEFFTLYSLCVSARVLGLLYRANSERLGWLEG